MLQKCAGFKFWSSSLDRVNLPLQKMSKWDTTPITVNNDYWMLVYSSLLDSPLIASAAHPADSHRHRTTLLRVLIQESLFSSCFHIHRDLHVLQIPTITDVSRAFVLTIPV